MPDFPSVSVLFRWFFLVFRLFFWFFRANPCQGFPGFGYFFLVFLKAAWGKLQKIGLIQALSLKMLG